MKKLTNKEREIMELYWQHGPMFVRELLGYYEEPKPHFNTLSTMVRALEKNGFLGHKQFGNTFQYYAQVSEREFGKQGIAGMVQNYFDNSYLSVVSSFVKDEKISVDELQELIDLIKRKEQEDS
jgi:predicted transcriptional regulator